MGSKHESGSLASSRVRKQRRAAKRFIAKHFDEWCAKYQLSRDEHSLRVFAAMLEQRFHFPLRPLERALAVVATAFDIDAFNLLDQMRERRERERDERLARIKARRARLRAEGF